MREMPVHSATPLEQLMSAMLGNNTPATIRRIQRA
jgi:hypothetical protein